MSRGPSPAPAAGRAGLFEIADGGTLFLDEIGELPLPMQSKLLRVLQDREVRRVGGKEMIRVDVRIISATNKDLESEMEKGGFREILLPAERGQHRAAAPARAHRRHPAAGRALRAEIQCRVPPRIREVDDEAMAALRSHPWPGNVRQLSSVIERAVLLGDGRVLTGAIIHRTPCPQGLEPLALRSPRGGTRFRAARARPDPEGPQPYRRHRHQGAKLLRMNYKAFLYRMEKSGCARRRRVAENQGN